MPRIESSCELGFGPRCVTAQAPVGPWELGAVTQCCRLGHRVWSKRVGGSPSSVLTHTTSVVTEKSTEPAKARVPLVPASGWPASRC